MKSAIRRSPMLRAWIVPASLCLYAAAALAEESRPMSPPGTAHAQVLGQWSSGERPRYEGGKWIEVSYGRPLLRGRGDIFGSGAEYGKKVNGGASVWRLGAN